jgi:hypothetical protein
VGFDTVFQQSPRAVTFAPPSELIFPPLEAETLVIALMATIALNTGIVAVGVVGVDGPDLLQLPIINIVAVYKSLKIVFIKIEFGTN